jgi:hypothetical protein
MSESTQTTGDSTNYCSIDCIEVVVQAHSEDSTAASLLNEKVVRPIEKDGLDSLFADGSNRTQFINDPVSHIQDSLVLESIGESAIPYSLNGEADIRRVMKSVIPSLIINGKPRRLTTPNLQTALNKALAQGEDSIRIELDFDLVRFDHSDGSLDYKDWSKFKTGDDRTSIPRESSTRPDDSIQPLQQLVNQAIPRVTSSLVDEVSKATASGLFSLPSLGIGASQQSKSHSAGDSNSTVDNVLVNWNTKQYPLDVQARIQQNEQHIPMTKSQVEQPFDCGNHYCLTTYGSRVLVTLDGTLVDTQIDFAANKKNLLRSPFKFTGKNYYVAQQQFGEIVDILGKHGYYAHHLCLYRDGKGGARGFTAGDGPVDDLPERLKFRLNEMSTHIFDFLSQVLADSPAKDCLLNCHRDG